MCARASKIWMLSASIQALNAATQDQSVSEVVLYLPQGLQTSCPGGFLPQPKFVLAGRFSPVRTAGLGWL